MDCAQNLVSRFPEDPRIMTALLRLNKAFASVEETKENKKDFEEKVAEYS